MRFHVITLFPDLVEGFMKESILKRAIGKKHISVKTVNPRDFTADKHRTADDRPYGGGPGMVLKAEPILKAVGKILGRNKKQETRNKTKIVILSPNGKLFTNAYAKTFAKKYTDIVLIAGRYEGIDARVKKILKADEVSVGPYILTGGEVPALVVIDAVSRQIRGVLGKAESLEESRTASHEVYTRPEVLAWKSRNYKVPKVLLSGHRKNIDAWRGQRQSRIT